MRQSTTVRPIRVVLADDHEMVRQGLAQLLEETKDVAIVGQAQNGEQAIALARKLKPDVVVLDYSMPEMDGATAARRILAECPKTRILILTVHENIHYAFKALEAGALGFLLKTGAVQDLVAGIRQVFRGQQFLSPIISESLLLYRQKKDWDRSGLASLSAREFELLRLLATGIRSQDCARKMKVKHSTVSTYRTRLMEKLRLSSTADIIRFAIENKING